MIPLLTILTCRYCGMQDTPRLEAGTAPHATRATCAHCGAFIKWLGKAAIASPLREGAVVQASVNRVTLLGLVSKYGVELSYAISGTACARFTLYLAEHGADGREHSTLVPCEVWGKKAEAASEVAPGQLVLFEGKVGKRRKGETWEMAIVGYELIALAPMRQAVEV